MSLKQELLDLANRLREACRPNEGPDKDVVSEIAAELRGMAKCMPDNDVRGGSNLVDDHVMEAAKIKARIEHQEARRRTHAEEASGDNIIEVVGGPAGDTTVHVQGRPPDGHYTALAGVRYQFREGKLHYAPQVMTK